jgi:N utilization substance protein B
MLNRRILRIKAMQALYSYQVTEQSLKEVINEELVAQYALDPAIHDFIEKPIFEEKQRLISEVFLSNLQAGKAPANEHLEEEIIADIQASMGRYYTKVDAERRSIKKQMVQQADNIFDWYLKLLLLPGELAFIENQEKERLQKSTTKKDEQVSFPLYGSAVITAITTTSEIQSLSLEKKLSWSAHIEEVKSWYRELIKGDEVYQSLANQKSISNEEELSFLLHFFKQLFFRSELTLSYMTEQILSWEDDAPILRNMLVKTIKAYTKEEGIMLRPLSINKEDDFDYFERLFSETILKDDTVTHYIREKAKNWDISRISATDIILLKMALTEMIVFPSIPVKVTINEYIEISKQYSTPKSKQFINGILDVLANELTSMGIVKKSGRGLIDNK